jgi:two-component system chemotaxis sensor kinase CheA
MTEKTTVERLQTVIAEIVGLAGGDKDDLVRCGIAVEEMAGDLATCPDSVTSLLGESLRVLQAVHADGAGDAAVALGAIAQGLEAVRRWLAGESDDQNGRPLEMALRLLTSIGVTSPAADAADEGSGHDAAPAQAEVDDAQDPQTADPPAAPAEPVELAPSVLPEDTDVELLGEFVVECLDHITNAEAALLELESNPDDGEQINTIFRAFHTIKGTSGFLGLDHVQRLAHLAENLLDRSRNGELKITGGYADLALRSGDTLRTLIEALRDAQPGQELPTPEHLPQLLAILGDPEAAGVGEDVEPEPMRLGDILVGKGRADREAIEKAAAAQDGQPIGRRLISSGQAKAGDVADALRTQKQQGGRSGGDSSVRVATDRLDKMVNMVGELVIAQSMVVQDPDVTSGARPRLARNVTHAGKIIRELQDLTMSLRMVPLKPTFQKMARLVRDLGRKAGKNVQLVTAGEETEIDRNMVEVLNDPLVHMIRNAVDHGIESAEARQAAGKPATGTVSLSAYHSAGNVVIELTDDGKGLDREKILAKATDRGLIASGADLSDSEVFGLIFQPGFSTAEKITDVSGRGVGMDVVKRNIEAIRGRADITSRKGEGSTFTLRLPLTMAITDAMQVRVGQEHYLLPTVSILQSFRPEPGCVTTVTGRGEMAQLRGELMPLFRLHRLFEVAEAQSDPYKGLLIVVQSSGRSVALMVDELLGQQQVVIKSLGESMGRIPGVSGGAILGDGCVGLILDPAGIVALAQGHAEQAAAA